MPAADELYLLSQRSSDLCADLHNQFQKYFDWLDEVVLSAKESRGETIIPKTPARKKKNRKITQDIENVPPPLPPPPVENNVRKSSRAAAKAAQEKTKKTIQEISNIGVKMRQPSTPQIEPDESKNIVCMKKETVEKSVDFTEPIVIVELDITKASNTEIDNIIENNKKFERIDEEKCNPIECINDDMDVKEVASNDNLSIEKLTDMSCQVLNDNNLLEVPTQDEVDKPEFTKPTRITRTKKRVVDTVDTTNTTNTMQSEEVLIRNTRSKRRKVDEITLKDDIMESKESSLGIEHSNSNQLTCKGTLSDSQSVQLIPSKPIENEASVCLPSQNVTQNSRITRSKVRKLSPKKSPPKEVIYYSPKQINLSKAINQKTPRTPKAKIESPTFIQNSDSPQNRLKTKLNVMKTSKTTRVHNTSIESNEKYLSPLVVKHIVNTNLKNGSSTIPRNKKSSQTPSPMSSSTAKMLGIKQSIFGSSGFQSSYAQKRKPIICPSPQVGGKPTCSTPTEGSRFKNIIMGPSFLTKVIPNKPSKEEIEEKKKEDIKRKREREEEIMKKREEMLKWQREEKKRKNEERMRKVQESRELKEKKEAEVRELQEKERKQREERLREERKRKLFEIKRMEELKSRKQAEEERQREERKLLEEQRLIEEEKAREREELKKLEEKRKLQEKLLQEKREAERIAREKLELERRREEQRMAREKEEIERLKMKEALRLQQEKLNETYTANTETPLNATYSKPEQLLNTTYQKTTEEVVNNNANDYNIADLRSDESTDDELEPKKKIPTWALGKQLKNQLFDQEHYPPNLDEMFPPFVLLQMPDLSKIFSKCRSRFTKRTSSAVWNTPPYKVLSANR